MKVEIEKANIVDIDELLTWRMEVLSAVFPKSEYVFPKDIKEQNRAYYAKSLLDESHIACFAKIDGERVGCGGMCFYDEMPSPDNPNGRCAYLMNIYCRPLARGQGVATAIVTYLVGIAKSKNVKKIYLETSKDGRKLYEKNNFVDLPDMMILKKDD